MNQSSQTTTVLFSLIFFIVGLSLVIWPSEARLGICYLLGAAAVIFGIIKLISFFKTVSSLRNESVDLTVSVLSLVAGIYLIFNASRASGIFAVIVGIAIIVDSIKRLNSAIIIKNCGGRWKLALTGALVLLLFGIFLIFDPIRGTDAAIVVAGVMLLIDSIFGIVLLIKNK